MGFGRGVYTSPSYDFGRKYGDACILCLALPGVMLTGKRAFAEFRGELCSFRHEDIVVYKESRQIIPFLCVSKNVLPHAFRLAGELKQSLLRYFPVLKHGRQWAD